MALFYGYKSRGITRDITISGGPTGTITPGAADKVRAILRNGETDVLTIVSDAPTANGSSFTKGSPSATQNRLRLDAADLEALACGAYTVIIDMFDNADAQEWKNVNRQVLMLEA